MQIEGMQEFFYLEAPRYKKTGAVLHGRHYNVVWDNGWAGPFVKGFNLNKHMATCPAGTYMRTESDYLDSEAGRKFLVERDRRLNERFDDIRDDSTRIEESNAAARKEMRERYDTLVEFDLVDAPDAIWADIAVGMDERLRSGGGMLKRVNSWKRVLAHVGNAGWNRDRFDKGLSLEWQAFYIEVLVRLVSRKGERLPFLAPAPATVAITTAADEAQLIFGTN